MRAFVRQLGPAVLGVVVFTVLCGLIYPLVVTGVAQVAFHDKANGSLVKVDGVVVGSRLIGQQFADAKYFHPRPSAAGTGYDGLASSASNLGPTNPDFLAVDRRAGRRLPRGELAARHAAGAGRRRHRVRLRPRSRHLGGQRQAPGGPGGAAPAA